MDNVMDEIKCGISICHSLIWLKNKIKENDLTKEQIVELLECYIILDGEII